jgi:hypothetical protein
MIPDITDDPIVVGCPGDQITISGTITGTSGDAGNPATAYTTLGASVEVVVTAPNGDVAAIPATLGAWDETNAPVSATTTFSAQYTPTEPGTYTYVKTATWTTWYETNTDTESDEFTVPLCDIDIKGGSCPNPFNPKSKGSVPVAILGPLSFLNSIDLSTLTLNGVSALPGSILEDSTQPGDYDPDCDDCFDADDPANFNCDLDGDGVDDAYCGDGTVELVVKFDAQELAASLSGTPKGDCVSLVLLGSTFGGDPIEGSDSVLILKNIP